ncbi:MAG: hypothetical protein K2P81_06195 [Bacteriovoracaceae bacterium]|nr:hypothetical protein [Bacteriovoracaceae bacterium]
MFSHLIKWLLGMIIGNSQNRALLLLGEAFSICLTLYLFKMTSQLVPSDKLQNTSRNYFEFLLIGEVALLLPLAYFENSIRIFLAFISSGFIVTLKSSQIDPYRIIRKLALNEMVRPLLRMICIFLGGFFLLETQVPHLFYVNFVLSQALTLMSMITVTELVLSFYSCYNRGLKVFYSINSVLALIGGAYFPVSYMAPFIKDYAVWLFPQTLALLFARLGLQLSPQEMAAKYLYYIAYILMTAFVVKKIKKWLEGIKIKRKLAHLILS